jgi:hypothetical protein
MGGKNLVKKKGWPPDHPFYINWLLLLFFGVNNHFTQIGHISQGYRNFRNVFN